MGECPEREDQAKARRDRHRECDFVVLGHCPSSQASAAAHETALARQPRFNLVIPEFWKLVQTCSQVAPFAVGFADGQPKCTMFAQTDAQVAELGGVGHDAKEKAKKTGMRKRFIEMYFSIAS